MKSKSEQNLEISSKDSAESSVKECDFEQMLEKHVGGWGRYQWLYLIFFAVTVADLAYVSYSPILYLYVPQSHWCSPPPELSNLSLEESLSLFAPMESDGSGLKPSQCQMYNVNYTQVLESYLYENLTSGNSSWPTVNCKYGWSYNFKDYFETAATDMDWVCDNEWKTSFSQSLFFAGAAVGTLMFGWITDQFGRFRTLMIANVFLFVTGIATPFCPDIHEIAFLTIRFLAGLSHNSYMICFYMLALEYVSNDKRAMVGNLSLAIWLTVGGIYQPWLVQALGEWRTFHHIIFAQVALIFLAPFFLDESCRWLISKGRIEETLQILKKIARINRKEVKDDVYHSFEAYAFKMKEEFETKSSYSWLDLFKTPRLRKNSILMILTWMLTSLVFDGHVRNISNLDYSLYVTFTIAIALELPADLLAIWGLNNLGRRWSLVVPLIVSSIAMIIVAFNLEKDTLSLIVAMIGRFFVTYAMNAGVQVSMEIVPTQLRGQGSGLANVAAQASTFFSPYIVYSSSIWEPLPFLLLAGGGILAAATSIFLPETAGVDLPNTIEEAESFGKDQSFFYVPIYHDRLAGRNKLKNVE